MLSLGGIGFGPLRTEAARAGSSRGLSLSGGGVGGKTFCPFGAGGCPSVRALLAMFGLTRFVAAKEMLSAGRSSLISTLPAFLISEPAKPVNALARSDAATRRALPR